LPPDQVFSLLIELAEMIDADVGIQPMGDGFGCFLIRNIHYPFQYDV
jgi:hypothetical protein